MNQPYIIIYEWDRRFKDPKLKANIRSLLDTENFTDVMMDLTNAKVKRFLAGIEKKRFSTFEHALMFLREKGYQDFSEQPTYAGPWLKLVG